jgi:hypothetical protein
MRIALLGPCANHLPDLRRAATFVLESANVDRAVYLGGDEALDEVVLAWASEILGGDASPGGLWSRTRDLLRRETDAATIRAELERERTMDGLRRLEQLPRETRRSLELLGSRVAILVDDRERLDEDDLATAEIVVYGKSPEPRARCIGARWFLSPGVLGPRAGILILEEGDRELRATFHDATGALRGSETIDARRVAKLRVRGSEGGTGATGSSTGAPGAPGVEKDPP